MPPPPPPSEPSAVPGSRPDAEPRHPIRVVARRTGLTTATLRAWERRYGVVEPHRSEGGQRLYSDQDVARLVRLRLLSEAGRPISLVASLDDAEAEALLREDGARFESAGQAPPRPADAGGGVAGGLADDAYLRVVALDGEGLEAILRRAAVTLGAHAFLEELVTPLLHRVGTAWTRKELGPAQEHLCTSVVERVVGWLTEPAGAEPGAPRLVVATLPGERHGLGARLVAAAAALAGWSVTHLGVDLPAEEIARAARAVGARAVALSVVNGDVLGVTPGGLARLREGLPPATAILLGGAMAGRLAPDALPAEAHIVGGLDALRVALDDLAG